MLVLDAMAIRDIMDERKAILQCLRITDRAQQSLNDLLSADGDTTEALPVDPIEFAVREVHMIRSTPQIYDY